MTSPRRILIAVLIALCILVIGLALFARVRYGGGEFYPDLSTEAVLGADAMVEAARYEEPIGNIAVSADGRLFFTVHPESRPEVIKVLEWRDGEAYPYPSLDAQRRFDTPLGMAIDESGTLWVIDHGNHATRTARLIGLDLETNTITTTHEFSADAAPLGSFLQDVQVSPDGRWAYVADVSFWRKSPGLVVVDLERGVERRVLDAHESVMPMDYVIRSPIKDMVFFGGLVALKPGVDGIALSEDGSTLAIAAMTHETLYTLPTAILKTFDASDDEIAASLKALGRKPLNDGLSYDREGNILITDVEHSGIARMRPDGSLETLVEDERVRWADALSHGPGASLYLADSAIPHQMLQSKEHIRAHAPYFIWKIDSDVPGVPGR